MTIIISKSGKFCYYKQNNFRHRANGLPAIVCITDALEFYENNLLHRDNNLPAITHGNSRRGNLRKFYYINGREYFPIRFKRENHNDRNKYIWYNFPLQ